MPGKVQLKLELSLSTYTSKYFQTAVKHAASNDFKISYDDNDAI